MSDSNDTPPRPVPPDSPGGELFEAFHHIGREFLAGARRAINAGSKVAPEDRRALAQIRVAMESQLDELRGDQYMAYAAHFGVEVEDELELVGPFSSEETADAWAEAHEPEQAYPLAGSRPRPTPTSGSECDGLAGWSWPAPPDA